jgi:hypothetical protein
MHRQMTKSAREDIYRLVALVTELDRVLHPVPVAGNGEYFVEPNPPPPLPPTGIPGGASGESSPREARSFQEWGRFKPDPGTREQKRETVPWMEYETTSQEKERITPPAPSSEKTLSDRRERTPEDRLEKGGGAGEKSGILRHPAEDQKVGAGSQTPGTLTAERGEGGENQDQDRRSPVSGRLETGDGGRKEAGDGERKEAGSETGTGTMTRLPQPHRNFDSGDRNNFGNRNSEKWDQVAEKVSGSPASIPTKKAVIEKGGERGAYPSSKIRHQPESRMETHDELSRDRSEDGRRIEKREDDPTPPAFSSEPSMWETRVPAPSRRMNRYRRSLDFWEDGDGSQREAGDTPLRSGAESLRNIQSKERIGGATAPVAPPAASGKGLQSTMMQPGPETYRDIPDRSLPGKERKVDGGFHVPPFTEEIDLRIPPPVVAPEFGREEIPDSFEETEEMDSEWEFEDDDPGENSRRVMRLRGRTFRSLSPRASARLRDRIRHRYQGRSIKGAL